MIGVTKRKTSSARDDKDKKRKLDGTRPHFRAGCGPESHPYFFPVGSAINSLVLKRGSSSTTNFELFEIEDLFCLMLDYLGAYTTYILYYFALDYGIGGADSSAGVISAHQTESEAARGALTEWCVDHFDEVGEHLNELDALLERIQRSRHDPLASLTVRVRGMMREWHDDSTLSDESVRHLFKLCSAQMKNRHNAAPGTIFYEVKEVPWGLAPPHSFASHACEAREM
jgi:hypothetical protein